MGLRAQSYKMAPRDPTHAKMMLSMLEKRNDQVALDDPVEPMEKMDSHMATQLMKAVATLSASNTTKRATVDTDLRRH